MTNPARIQTVEVYKDGDKPMTKKKEQNQMMIFF